MTIIERMGLVFCYAAVGILYAGIAFGLWHLTTLSYQEGVLLFVLAMALDAVTVFIGGIVLLWIAENP